MSTHTCVVHMCISTDMHTHTTYTHVGQVMQEQLTSCKGQGPLMPPHGKNRPVLNRNLGLGSRPGATLCPCP